MSEERAEKASAWRRAVRVLQASGTKVRCPTCNEALGFRLLSGAVGHVEVLDHVRMSDFAGTARCPGSRRLVSFELPSRSASWDEGGVRWAVAITAAEVALHHAGVRLIGYTDGSGTIRALGAAPFAALLKIAIQVEANAAWQAYIALREGVARVLADKPNAIDQLEELVHALPAERGAPGALAALAHRVLSKVADVRATAVFHASSCHHHACERGAACDGGPLMPGCRAPGTTCGCGAVKANEEIAELCALATELAERTGGRT